MSTKARDLQGFRSSAIVLSGSPAMRKLTLPSCYLIRDKTIARPHGASEKNQFRRTRAGSVRLARHAGNRQAKMAVVVITAKASPNTTGSCGLTL
jgi:hypothetical protein